MKHDITYRWPKVGKLHIHFNGNESVTLKYTPSRVAFFKQAFKASKRDKQEGTINNTHPPPQRSI